MATLIPEIKIDDLKKLGDEERRQLKSCEIIDDKGNYLFTFINPQTEFIRTQAEYLAQLSNSVGGEDLEGIL